MTTRVNHALLLAGVAAGLFGLGQGGHIRDGVTVAANTKNTLGDGIAIYGTAPQNRDNSASFPKYVANGETFQAAATFDKSLPTQDDNGQDEAGLGNSATGFFPFGSLQWIKAATGLMVASASNNPNIVAVGTKTSAFALLETRQLIATCSVNTYATQNDVYLASNNEVQVGQQSMIVQSGDVSAEYSAQQMRGQSSFVDNDADVTGDNAQCSFARTGSALKLGGSEMGGYISTDFYANNGRGPCYFSSNTFLNTHPGGCGRQGSGTSYNSRENTFGGIVAEVCNGTTVGNICSTTGAATSTSCPQVTWTPGSLKFSMIAISAGQYFGWTSTDAPRCSENNAQVTHFGARMLVLLKPMGRTTTSADVLANNGNALSSLSASTHIEQMQIGQLKIVFPSKYTYGTKSGTTFTVSGQGNIQIRYVPLDNEAFFLDFLFDANHISSADRWASYDPDIDCSGSDCSGSSDDDDLSGGEVAGIVIGVFLAIALVAVVGYYHGYHTIPEYVVSHLHLPRHHPHYTRVEDQKDALRQKKLSLAQSAAQAAVDAGNPEVVVTGGVPTTIVMPSSESRDVSSV